MKQKVSKRILACVLSLTLAFSIMAFAACDGDIASIAILQRPTFEVGFVGEGANLEGGKLLVTHRDGTTRVVDMLDEYVTTVPAVFNTRQRNVAVQVRYGGRRTEFKLAEILEPEDNFTLTWSDEFLGDSVNLDNWEFQHGVGSQGPANPWGNRELQFYRGENAEIQDGYLVINGRRENVIFRWLGGGVSQEIYVTTQSLEEIDFDNTIELYGISREDVRLLRRVEPWLSGGMVGGIFMAEYTSTRMRTHERFYQTFGRFEARMSIPAFPGSWNAFWMMPENNIFPTGGVWPRSGEIDIMENRGSNPRYVGQAVHLAMGNPGQHRMLFNTEAGQERLRVCPDELYVYTTHGKYFVEQYVDGMQQGVHYDTRISSTVVGHRVEYHFHTYRIDWRPEGMVWYVGYYNELDVKIWHEVWRLDNWRNPSGADGGWTGWTAGDANMIADQAPGQMGWNTAYLLTGREAAPFDHNFHLILNMAIGGMFDPANVWNIPDDLNVQTRVDWVRSWQFNDLLLNDLTIVEPVEFGSDYRVLGQTPNITGGMLEATFADGTVYRISMACPRIVTYPRRLETLGTNIPVKLDFRGRQVTINMPRVLQYSPTPSSST